MINKHSDIINLCKGTTDVHDCVEKSTYNLEETLARASAQSPDGKIDFMNSTNWAKEMFFNLGMCYSFNKTVPLDSVGQWMVDFSKQFDYSLIIHDPNYFMITTNPWDQEKSSSGKKFESPKKSNFFPPNVLWFTWKQRCYNNGRPLILKLVPNDEE